MSERGAGQNIWRGAR